MPRIDAHQHFWNFDSIRDSWIKDSMSVLKQDYLPHDMAPCLLQHDFEGCVAVQADQSVEETLFLLDLAGEHRFIKGVVGWVNLVGDDLGLQLQQLSQYKKLKGFRHILQSEPQRDFMLSENFKRGIGLLQQNNYTYDILIYPDQLPFVEQLAAAFPEQKFIVDHLAKPPIKHKEIKEWQSAMNQVSLHKNVFCKLSGMVTEADWSSWTKEDFIPYIDVSVNAFGIDRVLFGSDWPVCLVAASYSSVVGIVEDYFSTYCTDALDKIFGNNAVSFYDL